MDNASLEGNQPDLQWNVYLQRYGEWLAEAQTESDKVRNFRLNWPARFLELCKFHLSLLVDLPMEFVNEFKWQQTTDSQTNTQSNTRTYEFTRQPSSISPTTPTFTQRHTRQTTKAWQRIRNAAIGTGAISSQTSTSLRKYPDDMTWQNLMTLMDIVDNKEYLSSEGIFRKTGNVARQRIIRQRIASGKSLDLNNLNAVEPRPWLPAGRSLGKRVTPTATSTASVHDMASALKGALFDLNEPVLTTTLVPFFRQVASLTYGHLDENGQRVSLRPIEEKIAIGKQMKALRLLCLILPEKHRHLLQRLLQLLHNVLQSADTNRLSEESLGTLFAPLLLSPKQAPTRDLHTQYTNLARLATIMINQGVDGLWKIPSSLIQDIDKSLTRIQGANLHHMDATLPTDCKKAATESAHPMARSMSHDSGLGWTDGSQPTSDADSGLVPTITFRGVQAPNSKVTPRTISRKQKCSYKRSLSDDEDSEPNPALITCIKFVSASGNSNSIPDTSSILGETEYAVAELFASIQALPDADPRKSRLVQRFNATNGGLRQCDLRLDASQQSRKSGTAGAINNGGGVTLMRCVTQPLSPANSGLFRSGCINGSSAVRAARNIRSSLRRRLALRGNLSVSSGLKYADFSVGLSIPEVIMRTTENNTASESAEKQETFFESEVDQHELNNKIMSPTFDDLPKPIDYYQACAESSKVMPNSRISLLSSSSIDSKGAGEWLFCCPFVEVLSSPFKRRLISSGANTSSLSHPDIITPMRRAPAIKRKRVRYVSPQTKQTAFTDDLESLPVFKLVNSQKYFPIFVANEFPTISQIKNETNHDRIYRQKELTAFGYRTISNGTKRLSMNGNPISKPNGGALRRVRTMPDLKVNFDPSPDCTYLHESPLV